jgi:UDP-glucose 4-epimerase
LKGQINQKLKAFDIFNLGSGKGYSVLDVVKTYSEVANKQVPYTITGRREGDCDSKVAIPNKAL